MASLWTFKLYPQAAEGGGCAGGRRTSALSQRRPDPARSSSEAARRARTKLRRYCAANRLNRHVTLTYAEECWDARALRADVASFCRNLRTEVGEPLPYAWVPELHPGGHGFHVHVAVGRYIPSPLIKHAWGRGFIKVKLLGRRDDDSGVRAGARIAGGYLAKYASKDFGGDHVPGLHRYEVAQGFQPEGILVYGESASDVITRASGYLGATPERVWLSGDAESWHGPPSCWAQWD